MPNMLKPDLAYTDPYKPAAVAIHHPHKNIGTRFHTSINLTCSIGFFLSLLARLDFRTQIEKPPEQGQVPKIDQKIFAVSAVLLE